MIAFEVGGQVVDHGSPLIDGRLAWWHGDRCGISRAWTLADSTRNDPKFRAICREAVARGEGARS